jgi:hypothetical protein
MNRNEIVGWDQRLRGRAGPPDLQSQISDLKSQIWWAGARELAGPTLRPSRRGAVLVSVLVCLFVVVLLSGLLVESIIARQRQMRAEDRRAQAEWLAESAVERGAAHLRKDADFKGETWNVPAEELSQTKPGVATIRVEPVESLPRRRKLLVEALYPDDPHTRARASRELFIDLPASGATP